MGQSIQNSSYDVQYARNVEKFRKKNRYYHANLRSLVSFYVPERARVLQVGVDDGWLLDSLKPSRGVYVAASEALKKEGERQHPHLHFYVDQPESRLPIEGSFDYILLINSLGSCLDVQNYLERLHPHVTPDTRIIIAYYNYFWQPLVRLAEFFRIKLRQPIQHWLSPSDIENLIELAGFQTVKHGSRMLCPVFVPFFSWVLNAVIARIPLVDRLNFYHYAIARPRAFPRHEAHQTVSVVVPARNEAGNIESIVKRVPSMGSRTEIVFVEGNSRDETWSEIQRVKKLFSDKNIIAAQQRGKGKGDAVRAGFQLATGEILMILDADLTVPPEDLPKFYRVINENLAEYVHGTRLVYPMEKEAMRFLNMLANKFFSVAFSILLRQRIKDTLCGTKVISKRHYQMLEKNRYYFGDFDPFGDFDLIFGASKMALKTLEIPIHYKQRTYGTTNIQRFKHGIILLRMLLFAAQKFK